MAFVRKSYIVAIQLITRKMAINRMVVRKSIPSRLDGVEGIWPEEKSRTFIINHSLILVAAGWPISRRFGSHLMKHFASCCC